MNVTRCVGERITLTACMDPMDWSELHRKNQPVDCACIASKNSISQLARH